MAPFDKRIPNGPTKLTRYHYSHLLPPSHAVVAAAVEDIGVVLFNSREDRDDVIGCEHVVNLMQGSLELAYTPHTRPKHQPYASCIRRNNLQSG
jgi:hypothetical protein